MTTMTAPGHLALPPPLRLDLVDDARAVGWIRDNAVGFGGFADETEAAHAAWVAYRAISRRLARTHGMRPVPIDIEPLTVRRFGDGEAIFTSSRRVATLLRPDVDGRGGKDSFGFAIEIPDSMSELEVRAAASLAYRTIRKSGVRWALWPRAAALHAIPARPNANAAATPAAARETGSRADRERARRRPWRLPHFAPRPAPAMLRW